MRRTVPTVTSRTDRNGDPATPSSRSRCWPTGPRPGAPAEGERRSRAGILIPATAQVSRRLAWAEAVAVGPHVRIGQGRGQGAVQPRGPLRGRGAGRGVRDPARAGHPRRRIGPHRRRHRPLPLIRPAPGPTGRPPRSITRSDTGDHATRPFTATPIELHRGELARSPTTPTAWCPPSCRTPPTGRSHVRLDERRVAAPDARDRPDVVLEPEPPGVLVQGRDVRRPPMRCATVHYDCDGDTLLVVGRPGRRRRLPHRRRGTCFYRAFGASAGAARPLIRDHPGLPTG